LAYCQTTHTFCHTAKYSHLSAAEQMQWVGLHLFLQDFILPSELSCVETMRIVP
jgi:hypothetical protein